MKRIHAHKIAMVLLVLAALVAGSSLSAFAAEGWTEATIAYTLTRVSTGETERSTLNVAFYDDGEGDGDEDDGTLADDTLYLPLSVVFSSDGIAGKIGTPWVIRGDEVHFRVGAVSDSVEIEVVGGKAFVPALETLGKLGVNKGFVNTSHLFVTIW